MIQRKLLISCLGLLGLTISFNSYANCPDSSKIEAKEDGTHIVKTNKGVWTQFKNSQSYRSTGEGKDFFSFYYVLGYNLVSSSESSGKVDKIACIYSAQNNHYVVLISPPSQKYFISFFTAFNESYPPTDWAKVNNNMMCMVDKSGKSVNNCGFKVL